jgi:hypothetical protein
LDKLSFQNPLFTTYVIAASVMILKAVAMSWLTVERMMQVRGRQLPRRRDATNRFEADCS